MKTYSLKGIMTCLLLLSLSSTVSADVNIDDINTTDQYIEYTHTVYDSAMVENDRKLFLDSLITYEKVFEELEYLTQNGKKKIQNEAQRAAIQFYLNLWKKSAQINKTSPNHLIAVLLCIHKNTMSGYYDETEEAEILADLNKGKINQRLAKGMSDYEIREGIQYLQDPDRNFDLLINALGERYKRTVTEKLENPFFNLYILDTNYSDYYEEPSKGWDWIDSDNLEHVSKTYPTEVSYYISRNHPQYAVVDGVAFDMNGKIVYAKHCPRPSIDKKSLTRRVYRLDYENNKYDILKEPKATQDYLKDYLGIKKAPMSNRLCVI